LVLFGSIATIAIGRHSSWQFKTDSIRSVAVADLDQVYGKVAK